MKKYLLALLLPLSVMAMGPTPKPTPPPAPVVTNVIPALPEWARLDATVRLVSATGVIRPYLGSEAWGVFRVGGSPKTVAGELLGGKDWQGQHFAAAGQSFSGFPVTVSPDNSTFTGRTTRSWGYADIRATRVDAEHVVLAGWGEAKIGGTFVVTGEGVLSPMDTPEPDPEPQPDPEPEPTADILDGAVWWADARWRQAGSWPVKGTFQITSLSSSLIGTKVDPALSGESSLCFFRKLDGKWVGGPVDGIKGGGQTAKTINNCYSPDAGGGYPGRFGRREDMRPLKGETVAFCIASITDKARSPGATTVWMNSHWGSVDKPNDPVTPPSALNLSPSYLADDFLWKVAEHGGRVTLWRKELIPHAQWATINGSNRRGQEEPYISSQGHVRGAFRWRSANWSGPVTMDVTLKDGTIIRWKIPDAAKRWEGLKPEVIK